MVKRPVVLEVPLVLDSFYLISFLHFYYRFPENDCSFDGLLTLHFVKGIRPSLDGLCEKPLLFFCFGLLSQHLLPCREMKMCHVCYYNNSGKINSLVMNAEAYKVITKTAQQTGNPCVTSIVSRRWCTPKSLTLYASMRHC